MTPSRTPKTLTVSSAPPTMPRIWRQAMHAKPLAGEEETQGIWALNYLDMMFVLLSLFVLLYAMARGMSSSENTAPTPPPAPLMTPTAPTAPAITTPVPVHAPPAETPPPAGVPLDKEARVPEELLAAAMQKAHQTPEPIDLNSLLTNFADPREAHSGSSAAPPASEEDEGPAAHEDPTRRLWETIQQAPWRDRVQASREERRVRLELNESILFALGKAELTPEGVPTLQNIYQMIHNSPVRLIIEGHTDNLPIATSQYPSNWELSSHRAASVARWLITQGMASERIMIQAYGDTRPRASNDTPEQRALNRRVSLVMLPENE